MSLGFRRSKPTLGTDPVVEYAGVVEPEPKRSGKPRPIEEQTWRRHHGLRVPQERAVRSTTSGCARRRRKAIARRRWAVELREQTPNNPVEAARQIADAAYRAADDFRRLR